MKTFENDYTAWLDDALTPEELAAFEAGLEDPLAARREKAMHQQLRRDLVAHCEAPPLESPDFFTNQVMQRVAGNRAGAGVASAGAGGRGGVIDWWSRLTWAGIGAVAAAAVLGFNMIPFGGVGVRTEYAAEVLRTEVPEEEANISAVAFHAKESGLTVLWLDGLDFLPASHAIN